jgi:hypothetical protein
MIAGTSSVEIASAATSEDTELASMPVPVEWKPSKLEVWRGHDMMIAGEPKR